VRRQQTLCPLEFSFALRLVALLQQATQLRQALKVCLSPPHSLYYPPAWGPRVRTPWQHRVVESNSTSYTERSPSDE
jgi:hypothetical protein